MPKVALVCPTVGQTTRGYERFFADLKRVLSPRVDITLFKGGGVAAADEKVVAHLRRTGWLSRLFPHRFQYGRYRLEFVSFAIALLPHLLRGGFDLVHFIDPPLGRFLATFRRLTRARYRLLFTNGGVIPCDCSGWADHIQCVTPAALAESRRRGIALDRLTLLPPGVDPRSFRTPLEAKALRCAWGVPEDAFVILAVTTLNRGHKRVDHLIEEVSMAPGNILLWIEGGLHPDGDASLLDLAASRLPGRWRHTQVRSDQVVELLKMADVLVSTAVHESFGMSIVEGIISGLPVVVHDSSHFRWLAGTAAHFVDMEARGRLAALLSTLKEDRAALHRPVDPSGALGRFAWDRLAEGYIEMYEKAAVPSR